jgi:hypothetical protein
MAGRTKDKGVLDALVVEFESHRLPRLLALKQKVDEGRALDDDEIQFLEEFQGRANFAQRLTEPHPEYEDLLSRAVDLYSEIVAKGLGNQQGL